ncbi:MAG: hypothetical protein ACXWT4_16580 [Methylobacter sp.]
MPEVLIFLRRIDLGQLDFDLALIVIENGQRIAVRYADDCSAPFSGCSR